MAEIMLGHDPGNEAACSISPERWRWSRAATAASAWAWPAGLAQAGATVVMAGRDAAKSRGGVARAAAPKACSADAIEADVTDEARCSACSHDVRQRHGALHILVNNAGSTVRKTPRGLTLDEWRHVMDVNLTSAFLCCARGAPADQTPGAARCINIGSMLSIFGAPYACAYGASKGGIVQFTRSLATGLGGSTTLPGAADPGWAAG